MESATFAAGCFWGVEESFRQLEGVQSTEVGYCGGQTEDATYESVCTGQTGHAEAVRLTFDPQKIGYEELLEEFWKLHDPTTLNRQGPDIGSQYRSAIFVHSTEQGQQAEASKQGVASRYDRPVVTEICLAEEFHRAEEYHQQYFAKRGGGACPI